MRTGKAEVITTAEYVMLCGVFFLMGAETYLVSPLLPTLSADLGASTPATALVVTAFVVAYGVAGPPLGVVADRAPRWIFIVAGGGLFAAGNVFSALAQSLPLLVAARALSGLGAAMAAPSCWAYLAERTAPARRGRAISVAVAVYGLGQVLGVPLGTVCAQFLGWRVAFAGIGAGFAVMVPLLARRLTRTPAVAAPAGLRALIRPWRAPRISLGLTATLLFQAGRLGAYTYVGALLAQRFGFSLAQQGAAGLLVGVSSMLGSLASGPVIDRLRSRGRSEIWLSVVSAAVFVLSAPVALTTGHLALCLGALFVWCVAGSAFYSTQQAYLASADPSQRASVLAWNSSMMNVGIAAGTSLLGMTAVGSAGFAATAAGFGLFGGAVALALTRSGRGASATATAEGLPPAVPRYARPGARNASGT
ncbi:MFS transporter [Actinacidiphila sp. ITFR-21]|uniref:MFS transporter n=1 Tax=Actinacidiphila sp. ITFR-21 TaxID=3075199 RepID=UPI002889D700|nr:MFS transporter [Streptomyces sp. ITFR-21]WNI17239.1 MFS transporter [Streptomyces sp. ITFR-21]